MEQLSLGDTAPSIFTVSEVTSAIHRLLSQNFEDIRVSGEISGYKLWSSGHAYFTLKDAGAQLRCVLFKNVLRYMKFRPAEGMAVIARGSVEVRQERGEYQFLVSAMEPLGVGALQLAFEQLKQRLAAEGLFAPERKRALPAYPKRIGIVTSPSGAVIRDMLTVFGRRFPGLHIRLYPAQVQGEGSIEAVCEGLRYFAGSEWAEVVIVARGGGSIEDLWTFNEEAVARAIAASPVPVVSAVGHETDFTIADFVADVRAPTPSAAAEIIVRDRADLLEAIDGALHRAARAARLAVARNWQRIDEREQVLRRYDPRVRLARTRERWQAAGHGLAVEIRQCLNAAKLRFNPLAARLAALSPVSVLERGYSIISNEQGRVVKAPADAPVGSSIEARLARGRIRGTVTEA